MQMHLAHDHHSGSALFEQLLNRFRLPVPHLPRTRRRRHCTDWQDEVNRSDYAKSDFALCLVLVESFLQKVHTASQKCNNQFITQNENFPIRQERFDDYVCPGQGKAGARNAVGFHESINLLQVKPGAFSSKGRGSVRVIDFPWYWCQSRGVWIFHDLDGYKNTRPTELQLLRGDTGWRKKVASLATNETVSFSEYTKHNWQKLLQHDCIQTVYECQFAAAG